MCAGASAAYWLGYVRQAGPRSCELIAGLCLQGLRNLVKKVSSCCWLFLRPLLLASAQQSQADCGRWEAACCQKNCQPHNRAGMGVIHVSLCYALK